MGTYIDTIVKRFGLEDSRKFGRRWSRVLFSRAVSWKSGGLQSIVTLSSCEAEYVALCSEVCEAKYLRSLMRELGHRQVESTLIGLGKTTKRLFSSLKTSAARRVEVSTLMCDTSSWRRLLRRDRLG